MRTTVLRSQFVEAKLITLQFLVNLNLSFIELSLQIYNYIYKFNSVTRIPPMSLFCTCFSSGRITRLYAWTQLRNSNEPKVDFVRNIDFDQSNGFRTICINASTSGHRLCSRHYRGLRTLLILTMVARWPSPQRDRKISVAQNAQNNNH